MFSDISFVLKDSQFRELLMWEMAREQAPQAQQENSLEQLMGEREGGLKKA